MTEQNDRKQSKSNEELRNAVSEIIKGSFDDSKKKEMDHFVNGLDTLMEDVDEVVEKGEAENTELKMNMFRHKIALITFNGVLLALMVASKDNISFTLLPFSLLFFSIVVGLSQIIIYYFKNDYSYIEGVALRKKLQAISELCKDNRADENIINDAKAFLRSLVLENKKSYDNIPSLLKEIDKEHNVASAFIKSLFYELLFFAPFILGIGLVIYKLYLYVS